MGRMEQWQCWSSWEARWVDVSVRLYSQFQRNGSPHQQHVHERRSGESLETRIKLYDSSRCLISLNNFTIVLTQGTSHFKDACY